MATTDIAPSRVPEITTDTPARQHLRKTVKYLALRLLIFFITLWGAWTVSFLFFRLMPGDPVQDLRNGPRMASHGRSSNKASAW